jgi:hypothetical protein
MTSSTSIKSEGPTHDGNAGTDVARCPCCGSTDFGMLTTGKAPNRRTTNFSKCSDCEATWYFPNPYASPASPPLANEELVGSDVTRLVIAARKVAFENQGPDALKELDKASEAFADRVPWDDAPEPEAAR